MDSPTTAPKSARRMVREELTRRITDTARAHLARSGAAGLSLRAVARELGMASSAVYRYFPSRDALLTTLIVDAYDSLGEACEAAESRVERRDLALRHLAIARSARGWALEHPHEYALIYGTPVPGYQAPPDTVDPATRVTRLLLDLIADAEARGCRPAFTPEMSESTVHDMRNLADQAGARVSPAYLFVSLGQWAQLFGLITFELFGQFNNVVESRAEFFDDQVRHMARLLGILEEH
ncbi:MAG TPA: TetR/AcrR family transcriptional regulator [Acidimicrobiales bacterium]|nr:TetR/AcrR family transcriptional regulator [Acidimicrobiales bacterium]